MLVCFECLWNYSGFFRTEQTYLQWGGSHHARCISNHSVLHLFARQFHVRSTGQPNLRTSVVRFDLFFCQWERCYLGCITENNADCLFIFQSPVLMLSAGEHLHIFLSNLCSSLLPCTLPPQTLPVQHREHTCQRQCGRTCTTWRADPTMVSAGHTSQH